MTNKLPAGWEWQDLGKLCNLLNGFAFKANEYVKFSNTVIIRMGNIRPNGYFDPEHKIKYLSNKYAEELSKYILKKGDLIIAMTDLASKMKILGNPTLVSNLKGRTFMLNQRVGKLYDFNLSKINTQYLRYILTTHQIKNYYKSLGAGGLQINIGKQQILSVKIPLPPLPEQKRIVAILDAIFANTDKAIAKVEENIQSLEDLWQSVLSEVFEDLENKYKLYSLVEYVDFVGGSQPPKAKFSKEKKEGYIRLIQIRDYKSDKFKIYIQENSTKKFCTEDDVMIGRYGPPVFQILKGLEGAYNVALMKASPNENFISKDFIFLFLQNPNIQQYIINLSQRSAGQSGVNKNALEKYKIPLSPLPEQKNIVNYLNNVSVQIEKLKTEQTAKLKNLKKLRASVLDSAFKGKI